jgi:predicted ribosomally synthesized peptide with nif11-like leader
MLVSEKKLQGAADLDAAVAIAKEAGFEVGISVLLRREARQVFELTDEELDEVAGGGTCNWFALSFENTGKCWC